MLLLLLLLLLLLRVLLLLTSPLCIPPAGNVRGELSIWDVENRQHIKTWMAHKRSAITCVKFSHDAQNVYSCGEDSKVRGQGTWAHRHTVLGEG